MGRWRVGLALVLFLVPAVHLAQTTGDIDGRVTDTSGAPLPGVTIEVTSPKMQGVRVEVTGRNGNYRILSVPPGPYRIRASLENFEAVEETVTISLDATATLDLKLKLIVREAVTVTGEIPLVDVTSTTTGTNYTSKIIEKLPVARNYADVVRSNPGVDTDRGETQGRSLALAIYGATSAENQWIIDGINTTNVIKGFQGKAINSEFVDEVEVKTGGYQAEYGGALGGIINVITKSGGNQLKGDVFAYYDSGHTRAQKVVTSADTPLGMRITPATRWDVGVDLGGSILKDRLWFFAAYNRVDTPGTTSRYFSTAAVPSTLQFPRNTTDNLFSGKLTWNIATGSSVVFSVFADPSEINGAARVGVGFNGGLISNPDPSTWESKRNIGGTDMALRFTQLFGSSAALTAQASRHNDRFEFTPSGPGLAVRTEDWTCSGGTVADPCNPPDQPNSVSGGLGAYGGPNQNNHSTRDQGRVDLSVYPGNHEIKLGGSYQQSRTTAVTAITGGQLVQRFNEYGQAYYSHFSFVKSPTDLTPVDNVSKARTIETGFFLQDSWRVAPGLTVNLGLRWDQEDMRDYLGETVLKATAQWQPRLGIVWDPTGAGSMKIFASAGRFYYSIPTALSVFAYGSTTAINTFNFDPVSTAQDPTVIGYPRPFVSVQGFAEPVDAGIRGIYQDELTVGVERLIDPTFSLGIKGTYRRLGRAIEDRCDLDYSLPENNYSSCAIVNPGSNGKYASGDFSSCNGLDGNLYECQFGAPPTPSVRRVYRGIELMGRKSFSEKLWLQASYVYSSLRGNWDGAVNQGTGQTTAGVNSDFDYPQFWAHNSYGKLFLDRTHRLRLDASYTTPFRLFVGLQAFWQSGAPLDKLGYFNGFYGAAIYLVPRGEAGNLPNLWEANLTLGYPFTVGPLTVTAQAYLLNLFNNQIRTQQNVEYTNHRPPGYPDTLYDPNAPPDRVNANYGKILARQSPRLFRAAVRISF